MRAVIYARYSSDLQSDASIEDQLEVCRRYVERNGWQLVETFADRAISGASSARPGFQAMLAAAERNRFEVIVCEAIDRLGRRLSDVAGLHDRLEFRRVQLHAVNLGLVTALHVGMLGTMAQLFLSDLKDKTRRGLMGRVLQGRSAGGRAYGYRVVEGDPAGHGGRRIDQNEAAIVRRIFTMFASGISPRAIARRLNEEAVPGPDGRPWQDTTIRGQAERGTGILNNELYIGQLVWNRCSYIKDPRSGRRLARPNPPDKWERKEVPELRVLDDDLWQAVKQAQAQVSFTIARDGSGAALNRAHRRKFLLSGLLVCGECGGNYAMLSKTGYGCSNCRSKGICSNSRTIDRAIIEQRVLQGLKERLLAPALFEEFARSYVAETERLAGEAVARRAVIEQRLAEVERKIAGMVRAIEDGLYDRSLKERMTALQAQRAKLEAERTAAPPPGKVTLHPGLPALYRRKVEELERLLTDPELADQAMEAIRGMITKIVLTPENSGGLSAVLHGDLATILAISEQAAGTQKARRVMGGPVQISVVAGSRTNRESEWEGPTGSDVVAMVAGNRTNHHSSDEDSDILAMVAGGRSQRRLLHVAWDIMAHAASP